MWTRLLLVAAPTLALGAVTALALVDHGYVAIFTGALEGTHHLQVGLDLCIALALVLGFVVRDAREHGLTVWPFVVATPFLGSFGPLAYLAWRTWRLGQPNQAARQPGRANV